MREIMITTGDFVLNAELNESPTSQAIWNILPITGRANVWGDEIYFEIPVEMPQEPGARQDMEVGDLGYWPVGRAFCIFFGPTPVSTTDKPRAYSSVNVLGKVLGNASKLKSVRQGDDVTISKQWE